MCFCVIFQLITQRHAEFQVYDAIGMSSQYINRNSINEFECLRLISEGIFTGLNLNSRKKYPEYATFILNSFLKKFYVF